MLKAQKVSTKSVLVNYANVPKDPVPTDYKTYNVRVSADRETFEKTIERTDEQVAGYFKLKLFEQAEAGADFTIEVYLDPYQEVSVNNRSKSKSTKGKDGKTVKTTVYFKEVKYTMNHGYRLLDKDGQSFREVPFKEGEIVFNSPSFTDKAKMQKAWDSNGATHIKNNVRSTFNKNLTKMKQNVQINIDVYAANGLGTDMYLIGKKDDKKNGYATAFNTVKTAFGKMKPFGPIAEVESEVQSAITFFETEAKKYSPTDKKQYKYLHVCLYNLGYIHYWLDKMEEAEKYLVECMAINFKKNKAEKLLKEVKEMRVRMKKAGLVDRHPVMKS